MVKSIWKKLFYVLGAGVLAMLFSFWKTNWINKQDEGNDRMKKIGKSIADGAMAFLKAEYRILSAFVVVVAILLAFAAKSQGDSMLISFSFLYLLVFAYTCLYVLLIFLSCFFTCCYMFSRQF